MLAPRLPLSSALRTSGTRRRQSVGVPDPWPRLWPEAVSPAPAYRTSVRQHSVLPLRACPSADRGSFSMLLSALAIGQPVSVVPGSNAPPFRGLNSTRAQTPFALVRPRAAAQSMLSRPKRTVPSSLQARPDWSISDFGHRTACLQSLSSSFAAPSSLRPLATVPCGLARREANAASSSQPSTTPGPRPSRRSCSSAGGIRMHLSDPRLSDVRGGRASVQLQRSLQ